MQIGFYMGVADIWVIMVSKASHSPRTIAKVTQFHHEISVFSMENNTDLDPNLMLERLRGKFKAVSSLLGSTLAFTPASAGLSF